MSTRANYIFKSGRKTLATFYIHHDGYPEGAAGYFQNALLFDNGKISAPDVFLRANPGCEMSESLHGDIEYLYEFNIKTQFVTCYKMIPHIEKGRDKMLYHREEIYGFVNQHFTVFDSDKRLIKYNQEYRWKHPEENRKRIKHENTWHYMPVQDRYDFEPKARPTCLMLVYDKLGKAAQELSKDAFSYGIDNPNYEHLVAYQASLMNQLETLVNKAKEKNNG